MHDGVKFVYKSIQNKLGNGRLRGNVLSWSQERDKTNATSNEFKSIIEILKSATLAENYELTNLVNKWRQREVVHEVIQEREQSTGQEIDQKLYNNHVHRQDNQF
jgi:hypothetical protein